jgi:hypothetical protein
MVLASKVTTAARGNKVERMKTPGKVKGPNERNKQTERKMAEGTTAGQVRACQRQSGKT